MTRRDFIAGSLAASCPVVGFACNQASGGSHAEPGSQAEPQPQPPVEPQPKAVELYVVTCDGQIIRVSSDYRSFHTFVTTCNQIDRWRLGPDAQARYRLFKTTAMIQPAAVEEIPLADVAAKAAEGERRLDELIGNYHRG